MVHFSDNISVAGHYFNITKEKRRDWCKVPSTFGFCVLRSSYQKYAECYNYQSGSSSLSSSSYNSSNTCRVLLTCERAIMTALFLSHISFSLHPDAQLSHVHNSIYSQTCFQEPLHHEQLSSAFFAWTTDISPNTSTECPWTHPSNLYISEEEHGYLSHHYNPRGFHSVHRGPFLRPSSTCLYFISVLEPSS